MQINKLEHGSWHDLSRITQTDLKFNCIDNRYQLSIGPTTKVALTMTKFLKNFDIVFFEIWNKTT